MTADATAWTAALTDALLPADVSAGAPVRLDCSEHAVQQAAETLAIAAGQAVASLVTCLHAERLVSQHDGVRALARPRAPTRRPTCWA